ncbi:MAG TPA: hypothetical protein VGQ76_00780 [Thermoanaerobaculia bacterium]|nr:hypothetical protein [Thermoanaerobaculia bacterium]
MTADPGKNALLDEGSQGVDRYDAALVDGGLAAESIDDGGCKDAVAAGVVVGILARRRGGQDDLPL